MRQHKKSVGRSSDFQGRLGPSHKGTLAQLALTNGPSGRIATGADGGAPTVNFLFYPFLKALPRGKARPVKTLAQLAHGDGGVGHAVGEAPLVVVPGDDADECAAENLGLIDAEGGRVQIMVEV